MPAGNHAVTVLAGARVVTADGVLADGWVAVEDGLVTGVGSGVPPGPAERVAGWLVPGFVDLHVHGGGGHDLTASPADLDAAVAFHRTHGTTALLASLVTAPVEQLCRQLSEVADRAEDPSSGVLGAHLEGPFLSPARCGAHDPDHLLLPYRDVLRRLIAAARGQLRVMTLAPELPGALDLVAELRAAGVVAAVGHTDATYEQALAAFDRGATLATHLYNAMRPVHHRDPGPVLAALDAGVVCEVINDGVHVHPAVVREVQSRGPGRLALVTDAISAAGAGDGDYDLGGRAVRVDGGHARLADSGADRGSLAGSTLTMDDAVARAVTAGLDPVDAVAAATSTPARVVGEDDRHGVIAPGRRADLVLLDEQFAVVRVLHGGRTVMPSD
ncbi:N-acetylglucosamine-6-phosphate deacetylase [uncultured Jatrophihabitans sp.]|uniref:N-acetylglucosamine-6-phosphate deacetylase n=1 Tax=uncultured Jatrophihabitans sp. TaxID=1610747 RepID=UPI0035CCA35F